MAVLRTSKNDCVQIIYMFVFKLGVNLLITTKVSITMLHPHHHPAPDKKYTDFDLLTLGRFVPEEIGFHFGHNKQWPLTGRALGEQQILVMKLKFQKKLKSSLLGQTIYNPTFRQHADCYMLKDVKLGI